MEKVVVTGLGVVSAIGTGKTAFWKNLISGTNGIKRVKGFDTSEYPTDYGAEIEDFEPYIKNIAAGSCGRCSLYAASAARMAFEDAGIADEKSFAAGAEVFIGSTMGEGQELDALIRSRDKDGFHAPESLGRFSVQNIAAAVCREFGIHSRPMLISNACAAGNFAVISAYERIKSGRTRFALAGGADLFSEAAFRGFSKLRVTADGLCRPFDKNRGGMVLGEGAGVLLLESLDSALERNAEIYAEVIGWGASCDAFHMAAPRPDAEGIISAMNDAMASADISADEVDYICAHGTGTAANDRAEAAAINRIFARRLPVSSVKSMIGHPMGAAAAIEGAVCCMTIREGIIPPTMNFEEPDEKCDIDCVPNHARRAKVRIAANNAYAFGGNNSCVLFSEVRDG